VKERERFGWVGRCDPKRARLKKKKKKKKKDRFV